MALSKPGQVSQILIGDHYTYSVNRSTGPALGGAIP